MTISELNSPDDFTNRFTCIHCNCVYDADDVALEYDEGYVCFECKDNLDLVNTYTYHNNNKFK
jgi:hypothetical protein